MTMNGQAAKYYNSSESGCQVSFAGPEKKPVQKTWWGKRTKMELALFILLILTAIIAVALIIVLAKLQSDRESSWSRNDAASKALGTNSSFSSTNSSHKNTDKNLCLTAECVKGAARLLNGMNMKADPCEDFFEYACGRWNKENIIPHDRNSYNTFAKLRDELQRLMKDLLESPIEPTESRATSEAKRLYESCINETLIDERGLGPVNAFLAEVGDWPVVNKSWSPENFDLMNMMVRLRLYNNKILIDSWVSSDDKNSEVNIVQFDQPDLGMPNRDYYLKGRRDHAVLVYEAFAVSVAELFGAEHELAVSDMSDIIDLEMQLANITIPLSERRDSLKLYNKMMLSDMSAMIPGFDWLKYLQMSFEAVNITINSTEEVVVYAPEYLKNVVDLINVTDPRILANYLMWRIMMNRVNNLPEEYRNLRKEYHRVIHGLKTERPRWNDCVSFVNDNAGNAVGRLFIERHFDETAKHIALDMIRNLRDSFYDILKDVPWMDDATRVVAKEKAEAIAEKIGYPEYILNNTRLDKDFDGVTFNPLKYFENILINIKNIALTNLRKLREPVDRTTWSTTPVVVNAFYSSTKNQIMFPAGILQPPFYNKGYPKSLNYGGIGMVIGHEITHGFDDRGRQFDKNGNLKQWWDSAVIAEFKNRAQCIIDQYGNFTLEEVDMQINGIQTQGENIADNGGLKETYRAYKKWADMQETEEPRLPGMEELGHYQLLFINFAQVWCGTMRPEVAINRLRTGVHSPGRFRVIGTLQNMKEFSDAFNCSVDSYMNPSHKCSVW